MLKYMTLIRGNAEITYPIYQISDLSKLAFSSAGVSSDRIEFVAYGGNPTVAPEGIQTVFADEIPTTPADYGNITQNNMRFVLDTATRLYYCPDAHFVIVPVGEKPDDWNTNYFDYFMYQTGQVGNWGNVPVPIYPATNPREIPVWGSTTQYYKANTPTLQERFNHLFFTKAGYSFGVWSMSGQGEGEGAYVHASFIACNPRFTGTMDDAYAYVWRDKNGNPMWHGALSTAGWYAYWRTNCMDIIPPTSGQQIIYTPITSDRRDMQIFCYCEYNGEMYYGVMAIAIDSDGKLTNARTLMFTADFWGESISDYKPDDSGDWGEDSTSGGGNGTFQVAQDNLTPSGIDIQVRTDRFNDVFNNGGINVYQINTMDFGAVIGILYGKDFWDKFKNSMFNPLSAVLSCHLLPANLRGATLTGRDKHLTLAGFDVSAKMSTPIDFPIISSMRRYVVGSFNFNNPRYSDSFADFAPNTIAILHLPYIGECEIDINAFMYGRLTLEYVCDNVSGNCAAWVWNVDRSNNGRLKYIFTGNCATNIPLFSMSQDGSAVGKVAAQAVIGIGAIALGAGLTAATGGTGAGVLALGGVAKRIGARTLASAAVGGLALGATKAATDGLSTAQHLQSTGGISGNAGALGEFNAWLEIIRPVWSNPSEYQTLNGIPSNVSTKLSKCSGFTQVASIEIENCTATAEEIEELKSVLESGIIIKNV